MPMKKQKTEFSSQTHKDFNHAFAPGHMKSSGLPSPMASYATVPSLIFRDRGAHVVRSIPIQQA